MISDPIYQSLIQINELTYKQWQNIFDFKKCINFNCQFCDGSLNSRWQD